MRGIVGVFPLLCVTLCGQEAVSRLDLSAGPVEGEGTVITLEPIAEGHVAGGQRDGRWVSSIRIASQGAYGLQFLFEDLRLPQDAQLFVYELDASGEPVAARGVYSGSGPLGTGQFWSDAVRGQEAVVEVVYADGAVAALPFRLAAVRHLTEEGFGKLSRPVDLGRISRPDLEGTAGRTLLRGSEVPFEIRDGEAVFEGDILLGPAEEVLATGLSGGKSSGKREGVGLTNTYYRWPGGVVPYVIDPSMPSPSRVTSAVSHWNTALSGYIRLVPRTTETYYVNFVRASSASTCSSYVGLYRVSNGQALNVGDYCSTGNVIHEIGHAIGLFHEHTREDRDQFVRILWANISTSSTNNFTQNVSTSDDLGAYDFGSIMHYPAVSFSVNGQPTIETIPAGIPIGQRNALSSGDIAAARTMYGASAPPPPPPTPTATIVQVTIATNPTGRQVVVDGSTVTAPVSYQWTTGSVHTISAPNSQSGSTQYVFAGWSDGGAQTHSVTAPSSSVTYGASFTTRHRVTGNSSNTSLGSVALSPASSDGFYNQGSTVSVTATASGSGCLTSWSGVSAPASTPVQVGVTQPYSIVGNFQTNALSVSPATFSLTSITASRIVSVSSTPGCKWTAVPSANWITIISGGSGTSSGSLQFNVSRNNAKARTGTIRIGAATITITQAGK